MKHHIIKHFRTITKHRHRVIANGYHLGIFWHCLKHDLSKYTWIEFVTSSKYYAGDHSPVYEERLANGYFSTICQHHTRRNKHHYEYWTDYFLGRVIAKRMPYIYSLEYVADILSASKTYHPEEFKPMAAYEYFKRHSARYFIHPATVEFVAACLLEYANNGWKNLKKKNTKKLYHEIASKYKEVWVFDKCNTEAELPKLKGE